MDSHLKDQGHLKRDEIITEAFEVFGGLDRPAHFTNHTHCSECQEHDEVLGANFPESIKRSDLGTMGWDPITFTTETGFRYYLPGLIRVVLTETGDNSYYEQFLWHVGVGLDRGDRNHDFTRQEREVISNTLRHLLNYRNEEIEQECLADDLLAALQIWSGDGK